MSWTRLKDERLQENLRIRAEVLALTRRFFSENGFLEVETPIMVPAAGQEPYLDPLTTLFTDERGKLYPGYLITSPEYAMKKLLAAGFGNIFTITKTFRGSEPRGLTHNPEFTMIEWYRVRANYTAIMDDCEKFVATVAAKIHGDTTIVYQGKTIDLSRPWERLTMREAWVRHAKVSPDDVEHITDPVFLKQLCLDRGYSVNETDTYGDLFFKIFLTEIEPKLGQDRPTLLYEYPAQMAALARRKIDEPAWSERVEVYIGGLELANGFSELTDAKEQRERFLEEQQLRTKLGKDPIPLDEDFLDAVGNMPECTGIAFGIDRLVILLTDSATIDEVIAFPATELWPPSQA